MPEVCRIFFKIRFIMLKYISVFCAAVLMAACSQSHEGHEGDSESVDHGHGDEIVFTAHQAEHAGLLLEKVEPGVFSSVVWTGGRIRLPRGEEQIVVATSQGVLSFADVSLTEGASVVRGRVIAEISARGLQDGDPAEKAHIALETARKAFERAEELVKSQIISRREFDETRMRYESARAAHAGLAGRHGEGGVSVLSPLSGFVKRIVAGEGSFVNVGDPILVISENKSLQLVADVPQRELAGLRSVSSANFRLAYSDSVFSISRMGGRLVSYGRSLELGSDYVPVTFEFDNRGDFVPGAYAEVCLLSTPREGVISVPVGALTEQQGLFYVYVKVEGEDCYLRREVCLGQSDGLRVEVLKGLVPGESVVVRGAMQVRLAGLAGSIPEHRHNH